MKIWVIKLSPNISVQNLSTRRIAQLVDGSWKINLVNLKKVEYVIVMHQQKVIADYTLGDTIQVNLKNDFRVERLGLKDANNSTDLVGKTLNYTTANPSTIKEKADLFKLII